MYLSLIFLPLFGALLSNRWTGIKLGPQLSVLNMLIIFILTLISFYEISLAGSSITIELGSWIKYDLIKIDWSFTIDTLTISMFIPIIFISLLVQFYSQNYMELDPHIVRFYSYLSLFTFFMLILICGDNLLILFLGWEGVGLASYLLINFWFHRLAANLAAMKAFFLNRLGDWGLMLGIVIILNLINDISLSTLFSLGSYLNSDLLFIIIIFFMIGTMAKSAQFGLHAWLSDAMEGLLRALIKLHYMREHPITLKSTKGLTFIGKIFKLGQFAGKNYHIRSSETTREASSDFLFWFRGFTEGDGSFIINNNGHLEFKITQSSSDAQILFYIKKQLGFGSVSIQDKINKTHHFRIRDQNNLFKIIQIFNGHLITSYKIKQFKLWLNAYNKCYNTNISFIESSLNFTFLENAWLSGFTDAEGCFTVSIIKRSETYNQVIVRYFLSQKYEYNILNQLANLLSGKVHYLKSYDGYNMVVNLSKCKNIINYLKYYP
jgi:hypothetical protein